MNHYCAADDKGERDVIKCHYMEAYARECTTQGVIVQWRTVSMCRK